MRALPLLPCLLALAGCGEPPEPSTGRSVARIVSLLPSFTEILVELGAENRLVGITEAGRLGGSERSVARVPWRGEAAIEAVLRLKPDLVLRQKPRRSSDALREALERAGVSVLSIPSETIHDVEVAISRIGIAVGRAEAATRLAERFRDEMVRARAGAVGKTAPAVLFVIGRDTGVAANVKAAGPGSFLDELIRYAGGRNVLADAPSPYPDIDLEEIVRLRPEVIIDNLPSEKDPRTAWQRYPIPAVRNGRIYAVHDNSLLVPGPHLPDAIRQLVEMIHGS